MSQQNRFDSTDPSQSFPGFRPPVNRPDPTPTVEEQGWDYKPVFYFINGENLEFFTIGHLSKALNRSSVTIRSWENKGVLPRSPFRSPAPEVTPTYGTVPKGRRLWTREQIEGILEICKRLRVITDVHQKPPNKQFTAQVTELFLSILRDQKAKDRT